MIGYPLVSEKRVHSESRRRDGVHVGVGGGGEAALDLGRARGRPVTGARQVDAGNHAAHSPAPCAEAPIPDFILVPEKTGALGRRGSTITHL